MKRRIVIGMSGASGAPLTIELLKQLQKYKESLEVHLIVTKGAEMTLSQETGATLDELGHLATVVHDNRNVGAGPASGSFQTIGMIVIPCSVKTLAGIVSGYSDNLLLRAADVTLKERRSLVLVVRECPLGTIHLRNMLEASRLGAVVIPPVLSYYNHPETVEDCNRHVIGKVLDQFGLEGEGYKRWAGMEDMGEEKRSKDISFRIVHNLMGRDISAKVTVLAHGMSVLLTGGEVPHVGAVSLADEAGQIRTIGLDGHKEQVVGERWAGELYRIKKEPVSVTAGIHYDKLTKEQIEYVVNEMNEMLEEVKSILLKHQSDLGGSCLERDYTMERGVIQI
ncbi:polyprenyl P-hydroxybenzoate/phenylacrylic acid decarboxylase-like protein [Kineothrix alysoides]|uniref:Flavin prenyltransferase UbiX n=1 Tax=Kineothrix alysoides TaxID=1469948 RepID=A0A4R1QS34_9FIRM|nr:UbiX family flavin prenyltransferase [Kineothrix alysoides]TCL56257.1 polyprenyl P-hydroxybenzoate/phenylacrylic acid decarboxylase-like protein [Kineothrix alysoides]